MTSGECCHSLQTHAPSLIPFLECRPAGSDISEGETVLEAGERLGPAEIGLASSVGAREVGRSIACVCDHEPLSTSAVVGDGF